MPGQPIVPYNPGRFAQISSRGRVEAGFVGNLHVHVLEEDYVVVPTILHLGDVFASMGNLLCQPGPTGQFARTVSQFG